MVDGIETFYKDKINMLKERIETEKFERKIAQAAQLDVSSQLFKYFDFNRLHSIIGIDTHAQRVKYLQETRDREIPSTAQAGRSEI